MYDASFGTRPCGKPGIIVEVDRVAQVEPALAAYGAARRRHVAIYQFWSRWLTPLFQSEADSLAWLRDRLLLPMGRLPGGRGQMLRVLTGTQRGWLGRYGLPPGFLDALG